MILIENDAYFIYTNFELNVKTQDLPYSLTELLPTTSTIVKSLLALSSLYPS